MCSLLQGFLILLLLFLVRRLPVNHVEELGGQRRLGHVLLLLLFAGDTWFWMA